MNLLNQYLPRTDFSSYEDFIANYRINVPEYFNFGFDIVDTYAEKCPDQTALIWCDDHGHEKTFSFSDISALSNRAANFFVSVGIQKGDTVLMILRRRWEYWVCAVALHKIGAVLIPGSLLLTEKDIVGAASDFGGTFVDSMMKMIERAVVAAKREGVISDTHREEGAVAGAAHDAVCQVSEKAMGFSVGGKIGVARSGEHVAVAVFFTVGLVHLNEVVVGMGHRAI